jgi:hypothetical protein
VADGEDRVTGGAEGEGKTLERQIRAFHQVRLLAELPDRRAGSAGEREAALRVFDWMRDVGFDEVAEQAVPGAPPPGLRLALPLGLAAAGCAMGGVIGLLVCGAAALAFRREERDERPALSAVLAAPDSRNVVARAGSRQPRRRVVVSAGLDAPQAGRCLPDRIGRALRRVGGAPFAWIWLERLLAAAVVVASASALGASGGILAAAQGAVALALVAGTAAALEWGRAPASPGASDASGVAALLTCAEQLHAQLRDDTELWLVAAGAGHSGARGLATFLDAHPDWRGERTLFVHFDRVGGGSLHYLASEGVLARVEHPPRLRELARRLAEGGAYPGVSEAHLAGATAAREIARRGGSVLSVVALEADGAPRGARDRAGAAGDVAASLDMETVVRAADFAAAVVVAAWRGEADPLAVV